MQCRLCGQAAPRLGLLKPYIDYSTWIHECPVCHARLAAHDDAVHQKLHASARSSYAWHKQLTTAAALHYRNKDKLGLRQLLDSAPKNRMVMDVLDRLPPGSRVMEVGCSRGYLTAYSLLCGHAVLGVDVSMSAIDEARQHFGDHFVLVDDPRIQASAPYDLIYHVGTIGCVDDPVEMIRTQLAWLRSGGVLVCNAPDVEAAVERGRLWTASTTPPDLVTLFNRDWFGQAFSDQADVEVDIAPEDSMVSLRRMLGQSKISQENMPTHRLFQDGGERAAQPYVPAKHSPLRHALKQVVGALQALRVVPRHTHEYGILVRMRKR